jgi:hypothetical protein
MKKRGGAPKLKSESSAAAAPDPAYDLKKIQDHWIGLLRNTLNPSGLTINLDAFRRLQSIGYQGTWKNIRTNTAGKFISDEEMDDGSFLTKLKAVVGVGDDDMIVKRTSASSGVWQMRDQSTPEDIAEHDDYHSWLSTQNRDHIFWVPENVYNIIVNPN